MRGRLAERAVPRCPAGSDTDAPALASIPDAALHLRARALFIVLFLSVSFLLILSMQLKSPFVLLKP